MFAVFIDRPVKGLLAKKYTVCIASFGNTAYYKVLVHRELKKRDWGRIENELLSRCVDTVLMCDGVQKHCFCRLKIYNEAAFKKRILFNTALKIIDNNEERVQRLLIVDKFGVYINRVCPFVRKVRTIRIQTEACEKYLRLSDMIYDKFGVNLIVGEAGSFDVCICPDDSASVLIDNCCNRYRLTNSCFQLPDGDYQNVDEQIDVCSFLGLLSKTGEFRWLKQLSASFLEYDNKKVCVDEIKVLDKAPMDCI